MQKKIENSLFNSTSEYISFHLSIFLGHHFLPLQNNRTESISIRGKIKEMGNERRWRWWRFFAAMGLGVVIPGFLFPSSSASQLDQQQEFHPVVSRIAFGSCANQDDPQVQLCLLIPMNLILILLIHFCIAISKDSSRSNTLHGVICCSQSGTP